MDTHNKQQTTAKQPAALLYEAPRIELVLTAEELEREALYAGTPSNV